jgi:hypothetical protein
MDVSPTASDITIITANLAADELNVKTPNSEIRLDTIQATLAASQAPLLGDLHSWRDAGGALLVKGLIVTLAGARFTLSGDITPDQHLNPVGALQAEITSPATFVSLLAEAGALNKQDVEHIASSLTLAAIAGGGKLVAPIMLSDGLVQVSGVTIARLDSNDE